MALQKNYDYKGLSCDYWVVGQLRANKTSDSTKVILYLYKNRDARLADINNYFFKLNVSLSGFEAASLESIYGSLKSAITSLDGDVPFFNDALDV